MFKYRKEIDGLRGISIICVLLFHAKIPLFSGGFFGVDIFFVISGYLITNIILNLYNTDKFDIKIFYERRIRRIIPALYLVLLFLCVYSFFFQSPYFSKDLSQSIFFTPIFLQNFLNLQEAAQYFSLSYDFKSLGHTWSLSIEEQFYLLYPIFFLILVKFSKKHLKICLTILFIISLFIYFYMGTDNSRVYFFFSPSRIWEILAGCLLALNNDVNKKSKFYTLLGALLITFSIIVEEFFNQQLLLRVIVVLGTSIILLNSSDSKECFVSNILKNKILVFFGLISYSLYLWHVPIYSIYRDFFTFELNIVQNFILITSAILVSYLSFKFVETPFRNKKMISNNFIYPLFVIGIIVFTTFGFFGHKYDGFENIKINKLADDKEKFYISFMEERNKLKNFKIKEINENNGRILVVGDSLAGDVVSSLNTQNISAIRFKLNGPCFYALASDGFCQGVYLENLIQEALKSKLVILSTDYANEKSEKGGIKLYNILLKKKIPVKVVGALNFKYISSSSYRYAKYPFYGDHENFYFDNIQPNIFSSNNLLKEKIKNNYIDKFDFVCNKLKKQCKIYNKDFKPLFYDTKHLTVEGYFEFGNYLKDKI